MMMKHLAAATLLALLVASPVSAKKPDAIAAAIASPARPEADRQKDAARKPAELLRFAGIKPKQTVLDFIMGGGYLTRIMANAVGPKGTVYALQPEEFVKFRAAYAAEQDAVAAAHANVKPLRLPATNFTLPGKLDVIVTVQNYHDMHLDFAAKDAAAKANAEMYRALKPGGVLVVVDHVAKAGDTTAPDKLHRIDPVQLRQEIEAAGFRFDGESQAWRNPADPLTDNVFSPAIRGKTDQIAYRFRKPR
jgi:predicted methyltransferase